MPGFGEQLRDVQEGFGGNTTPIQTDTARVGRQVDEGDLHAHIRSEKGGSIASRTATNDDKLRGTCCHTSFVLSSALERQ